MDEGHRDKLLSVFKKSLTLDRGIDPATIKYGETRGWKSLAHMSLVAAIENEFDVMLDTADVLDMSSFEKAVQIVDKYRQPTPS